MTRTSFDRTY